MTVKAGTQGGSVSFTPTGCLPTSASVVAFFTSTVPAIPVLSNTSYRCGYYRICTNYSDVAVRSGAPNGTTYDWKVTAPWYFVASNGTFPTALSNDFLVQVIAGSTTAAAGTMSVRARNCNGVSAWVSVSIRPEVEYWCNHVYPPGSCPTIPSGGGGGGGGGPVRPVDNNTVAVLENNIINIVERTTNVKNNPLQTTQNKINNLTIYPNPTNGKVNISAPENIKNIRIFDIQGRLVVENNTNIAADNVTELDLSFANNGIYIVQISTENEIITQKLVLAKE